MQKLFITIALLVIFASCSSNKKGENDKIISVSIEPLRFITEQITGNDFKINVLVPQASSPETYEPTISQMQMLGNSEFYISIGLLDFEHNIEHSIETNMPDVQVIDCSRDIAVLNGSCGHNHDGHGADGKHGTEGADPHTWLTPSTLKIIANNIFQGISNQYPDSVKYSQNFEAFITRLDSLDSQLQKTFQSGNKNFMIYHPALTYLAKDYNLNQIAVENDGKEPSANHIRDLINEAKTLKIKNVMYQKQFSKSTIDALCKEIGAEPIEVDPLKTNVIENISEISKIISNQ